MMILRFVNHNKALSTLIAVVALAFAVIFATAIPALGQGGGVGTAVPYPTDVNPVAAMTIEITSTASPQIVPDRRFYKGDEGVAICKQAADSATQRHADLITALDALWRLTSPAGEVARVVIHCDGWEVQPVDLDSAPVSLGESG